MGFAETAVESVHVGNRIDSEQEVRFCYCKAGARLIECHQKNAFLVDDKVEMMVSQCVRRYLTLAEQFRYQAVSEKWHLKSVGSETIYLEAMLRHWVLDSPVWTAKLAWSRIISRRAFSMSKCSNYFLPTRNGQMVTQWQTSSPAWDMISN